MNLKIEERTLLSVLKAGLWNLSPEIPEDFSDWSSFIRLAKHQSVLGVVAKTLLSERSILQRLPNELRLKLKSFIVSNVLTSNHLEDVLVKVLTELNDAEVPAVLLKGVGLAKCYPLPDLRQCGDIDLYVAPESGHKAHAVLSTVASRIDDERYVDCGKHFTAKYDDIEIEIHRHISTHVLRKYREIYSTFAQSGLTRNLDTIDVRGRTVHTPEVTFNSYYVFEHLFEHFLTSGVGLRQLCDWMLLLHVNKDRIDRSRLGYMIESLDMMAPWQTFGAILVNYMGLPSEEFPFYRSDIDPSPVFRFILDDGNFGKTSKYYTNSSSNFIIKKLKSLGWHISRGSKMISLFPKQEVRHFIFIVYIAFQYIRTHLILKFSHGR